MQLVDSKLYIANMPALELASRAAVQTHGGNRVWAASHCGGRAVTVLRGAGVISRLKATSASTRLLALTLATLVVAATPSVLGAVRSAVSIALLISVEAGRAGLIAFQIFGR